MSDGHMTGQLRQDRLVKNVGHKAHAFLNAKLLPVARNDPGCFLAAML